MPTADCTNPEAETAHCTTMNSTAFNTAADQDEFSASDAALYDRQIRLWGLHAQKRLQSSRVLVCGITGLHIEVCKNIVLAGVKEVTLLDDKVVEDVDVCAQFFLRKEDVGFNRAERCRDRLASLNPNVKITVDKESVRDKPASFFSNQAFDVVCCCLEMERSAKKKGVDFNVLKGINALCRQQNIKFFLGNVFGFYGVMFEDLTDMHRYEQEDGPSAGNTAEYKSKTGGETNEKAKNLATKYDPLSSVLESDGWKNSEKGAKFAKYTKRSARKFPRVMTSFQIFDQYFADERMKTGSTENGFDWDQLDAIRRKYLQDRNLDEKFYTLDDVKTFAKNGFLVRCSGNADGDEETKEPAAKKLRSSPRSKSSPRKSSNEDEAAVRTNIQPLEMNPVCAIVGGVYGQEVLKCLSQKGECHNNTFQYDARMGEGLVSRL
eukprot:Nk52_evm4s2118 gene=Nk52_evmTU4s2118